MPVSPQAAAHLLPFDIPEDYKYAVDEYRTGPLQDDPFPAGIIHLAGPVTEEECRWNAEIRMESALNRFDEAWDRGAAGAAHSNSETGYPTRDCMSHHRPLVAGACESRPNEVAAVACTALLSGS